MAFKNFVSFQVNFGLALVVSFLAFQPVVFAEPGTCLYDGDRLIPVSYDVDVLVLGGTVSAVAAAEESAKTGAKTMLVTDRQYLGEDLTATLRLWKPKKNGDDVFVASLYDDPDAVTVRPNLDHLLKLDNKIGFSYVIDEPLDDAQGENAAKNRLTDGLAASIEKDTLQTNGPMTIRLDLGSSQEVGALVFAGFYRAGLCVIESMTVRSSEDGENWKQVGFGHRLPGVRAANNQLDLHVLKLDESQKARYWQIRLTHNGYSKTILAAELLLFADPEVVNQLTRNADKPDSPPRPLHVKKVLDKTLLDAGVEFLYNVYETGRILGPNGETSGILISDRAGRQGILAKRVVDLRSRVSVRPGSHANLAEAATVEFVVIGGEPVEVDVKAFPLFQSVAVETLDQRYFGTISNDPKVKPATYGVRRYLFQVDRSFAESAFGGDIGKFEELIATIRLATFHPQHQFTADTISLLAPNEALFELDEKAVQAARETGKQAGLAAKTTPEFEIRTLRAESGSKPEKSDSAELERVEPGSVSELLDGIRPFEEQAGFVSLPGARYEVAGEYDVLVIGGGTTGAPAGIAAARAGAKTLVVELQSELGGVGTLGSITGYYHGNKVGFTAEVLGHTKGWIASHKSHWWASELRKAGGEVWCGVLGAGAVVDPRPVDGRTEVKGALLATPFGPKVVLAKVVIDTTGSGDIARAAGSETDFTTQGEITVQGAGLSPRGLGHYRMNNDYMFVDDTDPIDVTHVYVYGKYKYPAAFDQGKVIGTRERRRIVGDFIITPLDQLNLRTYPDSIAQSWSDFDSHGYTTSPFLELYHPRKREAYFAYYPYRASLPRTLDGILVGALATSSHRDAIPMIRMQADLQNQGYALGYIAATAAKQFAARPVELRKVDIREVQKHLVEIGNLPKAALTETDNYEASKAGLARAVAELPNDPKNALLVMWHPEESLPLLKESYEKAADVEAKAVYARALTLLGDKTGEPTLLEIVRNHDGWDKGWNFKAYQQFGSPSSQLDKDIMMLGRLKCREAVPVIVQKLNELKPEDDFSHHRACYLALERIGDPSAARALAGHLKKPGMMGYTHRTIDDAVRADRSDAKIDLAEQSRRDSLREIGAARALYHLGDFEGLGEKILKDYSGDLRGHFARHAAEELKKKSFQEGKQ